MSIEDTLDRIATALESIATAIEGRQVGTTVTATLDAHPEPKTEAPKPKKKAAKQPAPEPEFENEDGEDEVENEDGEDEVEKPKSTKPIKFSEVRTAFFGILNDIRSVKAHGPLVARDVGNLLLKEFCGGSKALTEEHIKPEQYQAFLNRVEVLHAKYCK